MWRLAPCRDGPPASLNDHAGRATWQYREDLPTPPQAEAARVDFWEHRFQRRHPQDLFLRIQARGDNVSFKLADQQLASQRRVDGDQASIGPESVKAAILRTCEAFGTIQAEEGHWPGDYGGPMFLLPGLVITLYVTGALQRVLSPAQQKEIRRYLYTHQSKDGGWGLHIEGHSTMFGTALNYGVMRILGAGPDAKASDEFPEYTLKPGDPGMADARAWIRSRGGATFVTSWGKFWLAVLGVYDWGGMNPMPPEMYLLPYKWNPLHPGRFWCHCRMVYLPMSYAYARRYQPPDSEFLRALRQELYTPKNPYEQIDWNKARNQCAQEDLYYPHPFIQDLLWGGLHYLFEPFVASRSGRWLRRLAMDEAIKHIHYEDESTRYVDIGPVNKSINMLCCWLEDPNSEAFEKHLSRVADYLWVAEDGMRMQGYNGSQLWDTAFAVQAMADTGLAEHPGMAPILRKANNYIDTTQVRENSVGDLSMWYRHPSIGAWPFSTRDHGWPISDCSAEGLKAALALARLPEAAVGKAISGERLGECVDLILSLQNSCGGWATYELARSYAWLEHINPSETFGDIMIDYPCVECTSACVTALVAFQAQHPNHRPDDIKQALAAGVKFVKSVQRPDGSWYGSWGVCFTYGTWFGLTALAAAGYSYETSERVKAAVFFLLSKQLPDGGWGESYLSCQDKVYTHTHDNQSHCVMTSWAMLALMSTGQAQRDAEPLTRAAKFLLRSQQPDGEFPQQAISGVFNRNCMITYINYRNIFPIWALGQYRTEVLLAS
eukprot:jgi/Chlat1/534/Chrsp103S01002